MATHGDVLTVRRSNHTIDRLIEILREHYVTAVADLRSAPYSKLHAQFNREFLTAALKPEGIVYFFFGKELGGRPADQKCYENGRVQYRRIADTALFRSGIERVRIGAQSYRIALMCAEREPLECHRTLLVASELEKSGISVFRVHADGARESHSDAMGRLLSQHKLPEEDLFRSRSELIEEACYRQQERVAFAEKALPQDAGQVAR